MALPPAELERLDTLARCRIAGTPPEAEFDDLVQVAVAATGYPLAMFCLVEAEQVWVKAAQGLSTGALPREHSPCALAIEAGELALDDAALDVRFVAHPLFTGPPFVRAYAAVSLRVNGSALGTLALMDTRPRSLDAAERAPLLALGRQASRLLELRLRSDQRLLEREALLRSATRISGVGCWQWDLISGAITWSDEMFAIFGLPRDTPITLADFATRVHPDDQAAVSERQQRALAGAVTDFPDYRIVRPDGSVRVVHACAEVERRADGRPLRMTGALHDVTAEREAEERRSQLARSAMQTQKLESLGVLAAGVAHDFNNLLVGVQGHAELALTDRTLPSSTRDQLQQIIEATQRAAILTRQLLAYTGRSPLRRVPGDLALELQARLDRWRAALPGSVVLRATLPRGLPAVEADFDAVELLTHNLVLNAAESYHDTPGEVTLRAYATTVGPQERHDMSVPTPLVPGQYVVLEVSDRGCGIATATLERAFEPFFTTKFTGRGLGLPAVLGIARSHHSVLTVDSGLGHGTLARVHFPALDRPVSPTAPEGAPSPAYEQPLAGRTVLVVDDERLVRNVERLAMEQAGIVVLEAENGDQAIEVLAQQRERVDLVLLDLMMPGLDTASTLRALRALRPDLPVIIQSGYPEDEAARASYEVGGKLDFLQKPFSVRTLLAKVGASLQPAAR